MPEEYIQKDGYQIHTRWNDMHFGGSALVGKTDATYSELVQWLGEPMKVGGKMIDKRWLLVFDDGTAATIFNYYNDDTFSVGGFGATNKEKQNLSLLKVTELVKRLRNV